MKIYIIQFADELQGAHLPWTTVLNPHQTEEGGKRNVETNIGITDQGWVFVEKDDFGQQYSSAYDGKGNVWRVIAVDLLD